MKICTLNIKFKFVDLVYKCIFVKETENNKKFRVNYFWILIFVNISIHPRKQHMDW